jgi:chaperonin GroES
LPPFLTGIRRFPGWTSSKTENLASSGPVAENLINRTCQTFINQLTIKTKRMAESLKVTPLHDRVIVKPAAAEEKTAGGIIIPDTAKEKPQRGTVIAAGPGKKDEPVTVKAGDAVLYGKYAGTEIQIDGGDYLIMRESDILAIV